MAETKQVAPALAAGMPREQFAVVFPVKRPAEYRWRFEAHAGPWREIGARIELSPPPNATGIEWRNPEPSGRV